MSELDLGSDKTLEEFGSALLSRKSELRKKARKRQRRYELPMKLLTGGLALGSVFKNAAGRRIKEIEANNKLDLVNSKIEAPRYARSAMFVEPLIGFEGTVEDFKKDKQRYNRFRSNVNQYIDPLVEAGQVYRELGYATHDQYRTSLPKSYNETITVGADAVLKQLLTKGENNKYTYQRIVDAMRNIVPDELSDEEMIKQVIGLSVEDLDVYKTQNALNRAGAYKSQGSYRNIVDNMKNALGAIGILNKQAGGINLFEKADFDDNKIIGGTLTDLLDSIDFDTNTQSELQSHLVTYKDSPRRFINSVSEQSIRNTEQVLDSLAATVSRGEVYDPTGAYDFYEGTDLRRFISNMKEDYQVNYKQLTRNATILSNLIEERPELGRQIYIDDARADLLQDLKDNKISKKDFIPMLKQKVDAFETRIVNDPIYRLEYSLLKTLRSGAYDPLDGSRQISREKTYLGTQEFLYSNARMLDKMEKFLDETVRYDKQSGYSLSPMFLKDAKNEDIVKGIQSFVERSILEEGLNQGQAESIAFLTDINASQYFTGNPRIEDIYRTITENLIKGN